MFTFGPECCSASLRNGVQLCRNPQVSVAVLFLGNMPPQARVSVERTFLSTASEAANLFWATFLHPIHFVVERLMVVVEQVLGWYPCTNEPRLLWLKHSNSIKAIK